MEHLFLDYIKEKITHIIDTRYSNRNSIIVWNDPYVYEDLDQPTINLRIDNEDTSECRVYSVAHLLQHDVFHSFKSAFGCPIRISGYTITLEPILNEFDNIIDYLEVHLVSKDNSKISIYLDGNLFNYPNKLISLNFINKNEYVIHLYDKDIDNKKTFINYIFKDYR